MRLSTNIFRLLALTAALNTSCGEEENKKEEEKTPSASLPADVVTAAKATPTLSTLVSLVSERPAIAEALRGSNLTVFAPTNEAFEKAKLSGLSAETITAVLQYHVVSVANSEGILSTELEATQAPATLTKEKVFVVKSATGVTVNGSASVTTADVKTANGSVVHIINEVLLPDALGNVVQAVAKRYDLSSLKGAVVSRTEIATALSAASATLTVFAPSNAAFAALGTVPTGTALDGVLKYHVLGTKVESKNITASSAVATLNGASITVAPENGTVTITDSTTTKAKVTEADIKTTNGVIHIIDKVLIPAS